MARTTIRFPQAITQHYIDTLKRNIHVDGVLLFGSFAWGKPTKHSDVDLVVISPDFGRKPFSERLQWLSHMRDDRTYQIGLDVVGYTPREFAEIEQRSAIMAKAKRDGEWLYRKRSPHDGSGDSVQELHKLWEGMDLDTIHHHIARSSRKK